MDRVIANTLTRSYWDITLPNVDLVKSSERSPVLQAYDAALNLLNAPVLFSQLRVNQLLDPALRAKKSHVERHHLFPKKHLERLKVKNPREVNQIANFALLEWNDNVRIADKSPAEYYPLYADRFDADDLEQMMKYHALPKNWTKMSYERFLSERRKLIAQVIREGFESLKLLTERG